MSPASTSLPYSLAAWGWDDRWAAAFAPFAESGMWPARDHGLSHGQASSRRR
jgi:ribosome biogenesis GTPase